MKSQLSNINYVRVLLGLLLIALSFSAAEWAQAQAKQLLPKASAPEKQKSFATPQLAADALIKAAESYDVPSLLEIFGPEAKDLVASADPVMDKSQARPHPLRDRSPWLPRNTSTRHPAQWPDGGSFPPPAESSDPRALPNKK